MSLIRQCAIRNELLYSGFVLQNVQIFCVQKISFATFGVGIDDFFTRYAGLGYSLPLSARQRNGVSLAGRPRPANSDIWILPPLVELKKTLSKLGPPLAKNSGPAHADYQINLDVSVQS